jgi:hypothetical protein
MWRFFSIDKKVQSFGQSFQIYFRLFTPGDTFDNKSASILWRAIT